MNKILKIIGTSIALPLAVTLITLGINKYIEKKEKKEILEINFLILIKDIKDLLLYLETVILERKILDPYTLQNLNYNQILIDYNNLYSDESEDSFIYNVLDFYNIRMKIKKQIIEIVETPKISEYLDIQLNTNKKNIWTELGYIKFVVSVYKELEVIFIKNNLQDQLVKWDNTFTFKSLGEIKEGRKQILSTRKKELEDNLNRIMDENDIDLTKDELELGKDEKELKKDLLNLEANYHSRMSAEDYWSNNEFNSLEEVHYVIKDLCEEIYDIKAEIE